jgi:hypothetical protein
MSEPTPAWLTLLLAALVAIPPTIAALAALVAVWHARQAVQDHVQVCTVLVSQLQAAVGQLASRLDWLQTQVLGPPHGVPRWTPHTPPTPPTSTAPP